MKNIRVSENTYLKLINLPYIQWKNYFELIIYHKKKIIKLIEKRQITDIEYVTKICRYYDILHIFVDKDSEWDKRRSNNVALFSMENFTFYKIYYNSKINCMLFLETNEISENIQIRHN